MKKRRVILPVDERLIPHIFSFGHISGLPRLFLIIEMIFSTTVVLLTSAALILGLIY